MKARIVLIVVLAILIALQIGYLVKRIRTAGYSSPTSVQAPSNLAGAPGGEPIRPTGAPMMPSPGSVPSGKAPPAPSGVPSPLAGAPPPGGAPPAPSGMPSGAPPPGGPGGAPPPGGGTAPPVSVTVEMLPCAEILAGIISLQDNDKVCLAADQKKKLQPLVKDIGEVFAKPTAGSKEVTVLMQQTLKPHQIAYIAAHRGEPPPLDVDAAGAPPGPGTPGVGPAAVKFLKKRAAESPTPQPSPSSAVSTANIQMMGPEDVLGGILKLENDKTMALSPAQARALVDKVEAMVISQSKLNELATAVVAILTADQKAHVLKLHDKYMAENMKGMAPPEKIVSDLQHRLQ